jgi:osmotically-inducible protein OsmY
MKIAALACALSLTSSAWLGGARAQAVRPDAPGEAERDAADAATTVRVGHQIARAAPAADHLDITTRNGIVTLAGRVDSERMRHRVVGLAIATAGVVAVNDQLVVVPEPSAPAHTAR